MRTILVTAAATLFMAALVTNGRHLAASPAEKTPPRRSLSVLSLNTAKEPDAAKILHDLNAAPRLRSADVLLLQEVANQQGKPSVADQVAQRLGYYATFSPAEPGVYDQGLAIVSRYPLTDIHIRRLKACDLRFRCRSRFALAATVTSPWGGVRVWNAHLDTRINSAERLLQIGPVIEEASKQPGPALIGGDFNTNEFRWLGNVVPVPGGPKHGSAIHRAMGEHGFITPFNHGITTFPGMGRQLDWIFVRDLKPVDSSVEPAPFSDHHAIWTRVEL